MHKERVRIYNCVVYWDGASLCVKHNNETTIYRVKSYKEAIDLAKDLNTKNIK